MNYNLRFLFVAYVAGSFCVMFFFGTAFCGYSQQKDEKIPDAGPAISELPRGDLCMKIELVAGEGGQLAAGESGHLLVWIGNISKKSACVLTIVLCGKGGVECVPSGGDINPYFGMSLATFVCIWTRDGKEIERQVLDAPDDPLELVPEQSRQVVRSIRAPATAGVYGMRVTLNTTEAWNSAVKTHNSVMGIMATKPVSLVATLDHVKIIEKRRAGVPIRRDGGRSEDGAIPKTSHWDAQRGQNYFPLTGGGKSG
jgi:hypothetical protein